MLNIEDAHITQLAIRSPARITSIEILLIISKGTLISFEYILLKEKIPLILNKAEITLLRSLKACI